MPAVAPQLDRRTSPALPADPPGRIKSCPQSGEAHMEFATKQEIAVTAEDIFGNAGGTAFPYGHNAHHEQQEQQDKHDSQEIHSIFKGQSGESSNADEWESFQKLPLNVAVRHAHTSARLHYSEPRRKGKTPMFPVARMLRGHPELVRLPSEDAARLVEGHLRAFDGAPFADGVWAWAFPWAGTEDEILLDFQHSWDNVRHVPGANILADALRLADQHPVQTANDRGKLYSRFVAMAFQLQKLNGEKVIMLPVERVARLLGCPTRTISHMRHFGMEDGYLVQSADYSFGRRGVKNKATEFRFLLQEVEDRDTQ
jgi:hypothetical protein